MEAVQHTMMETLRRFNTTTAKVEGITGEVHVMQQHVEDFGEDLDSVKCHLKESNKAKQACININATSGGGGTDSTCAVTDVFDNKGPPLMESWELHIQEARLFT
jgi:hypothetical protein